MVQLHPEYDYMVVVEVDFVIATMKAQARAQDPITPERPSSWTYSILDEFKIRPQENIARRDDCKVLKFVDDSPFFISGFTRQ
jgi:hypothetical protein